MKKFYLKTVKMVKVHTIDGDTIDGYLIVWKWLRRSKVRTRIRLAGIDAPEMKPTPQPYAESATKIVYQRIEGKTIHVQFAVDRYTGQWILESGGNWQHRRLLGIVYYGIWKKNLNVEIVSIGLAKVYPRPTWMVRGFEKRLLSAEKIAQRRQKGVWSRRKKERGSWWWLSVGIGISLLLLLYVI